MSATYEEVLPWDHLDSGLDKDWLWEDWQDALDETEVEDCRWTPCFDCGVCPQMDTRDPDRPDRQEAAAADGQELFDQLKQRLTGQRLRQMPDAVATLVGGGSSSAARPARVKPRKQHAPGVPATSGTSRLPSRPR